MMPTIQEVCDEISVISAFLRDTDERGELVPPVEDIIKQPLIDAMFNRLRLIGMQTIPDTIIEVENEYD